MSVTFDWIDIKVYAIIFKKSFFVIETFFLTTNIEIFKFAIPMIIHHATTIHLVGIACHLACQFLVPMSAAVAIAGTMTTATAPTLTKPIHAKKAPVTKTSAPIRQELQVL